MLIGANKSMGLWKGRNLSNHNILLESHEEKTQDKEQEEVNAPKQNVVKQQHSYCLSYYA